MSVFLEPLLSMEVSGCVGAEIGKRKRFLPAHHSTAMQNCSGIDGIWSKACITHYFVWISPQARSKICLQSCTASACFNIFCYYDQECLHTESIICINDQCGTNYWDFNDRSLSCDRKKVGSLKNQKCKKHSGHLEFEL